MAWSPGALGHRVLINLVYVSSYVISRHLQPLQRPPPLRTPLTSHLQPAPRRAPPYVHTVGCTPNDIIVITHYLTSEATLQMILARSAFHYDAAQVPRQQQRQQQNGSAISDAASYFARVFETVERRVGSIIR